jgi:hypothetical protein
MSFIEELVTRGLQVEECSGEEVVLQITRERLGASVHLTKRSILRGPFINGKRGTSSHT